MVGWPLRATDSDRVELGGPRMHAHAQKYKRVNVTSNMLANGSVVYSVHVLGPHLPSLLICKQMALIVRLT